MLTLSSLILQIEYHLQVQQSCFSVANLGSYPFTFVLVYISFQRLPGRCMAYMHHCSIIFFKCCVCAIKQSRLMCMVLPKSQFAKQPILCTYEPKISKQYVYALSEESCQLIIAFDYDESLNLAILCDIANMNVFDVTVRFRKSLIGHIQITKSSSALYKKNRL